MLSICTLSGVSVHLQQQPLPLHWCFEDVQTYSAQDLGSLVLPEGLDT